MHAALPSLNALRAFEAAARHLSMTKAAAELNLTPGALSHQIRGLEAFLGAQLFERKPRALALSAAGRRLQPGLQAGFAQIRDAVAAVRSGAGEDILVVSTPPGLTAKWLAPRLYRFSSGEPDIDVRVSSSMTPANFVTDGVHVAIRNLAADYQGAPGLKVEKLLDIDLVTVCSPKLAERFGPLDDPDTLRRVPLIHDETYVGRQLMPAWKDVLKLAGIEHEAAERGLKFNASDHALDAAVEGAGILLTHMVFVHDDLRTGRLVRPLDLTLASGRAYFVVSPASEPEPAPVKAFRAWVKQELAELKPARAGA